MKLKSLSSLLTISLLLCSHHIDDVKAAVLKPLSITTPDDEYPEPQSRSARAIEDAFGPYNDCPGCYSTSPEAARAGRHMEKAIGKAWERYENRKEKRTAKKEKKEAIQKVKDKQIEVEEKKQEKIEKKPSKKHSQMKEIKKAVKETTSTPMGSLTDKQEAEIIKQAVAYADPRVHDYADEHFNKKKSDMEEVAKVSAKLE